MFKKALKNILKHWKIVKILKIFFKIQNNTENYFKY